MTNHEDKAQAALQDRRNDFFEKFPNAKTLDVALRTESNPTPLFFLTDKAAHVDLKGVGFTIGRLGIDVERQFLVNGEVAIFFAPWRDFQRRSFNVMTQGLADFSKAAQKSAGRGERFTPSSKLAIVVSEDAQAQSKLEEWQNDSNSSTILIAVAISSEDPESARLALLQQLRAGLGDRDLYRAQNPVTGEDFFGRHDMLRNASAALQSDENIVILGLRRSGKTSVLRELKRRMLARGTVVTMGDLQVLEQESVGSLAKSIASNLFDDLRDARKAGLDVKISDNLEKSIVDMTLSDLSDTLKRVANRNAHLRFVVAVDEIESAARLSKTEPEQVRTLLAALRAAAQACPNLSLAFSGVANRMFRSTILGTGASSVDNPMFGQVSSIYLNAFSHGETANLLRKLGRPMFLKWTPEAISDVQLATGGMPYFVRDLASAVRKHTKQVVASSNFSMVDVTSEDVNSVLPRWREDAGRDWKQLIEALRLHYPEAADLLDPSLSNSELEQWIQGDVETSDAAEDLSHLGLLLREGDHSWSRTPALRAVHQLLADRPSPADSSLSPATGVAENLISQIRGGETHTLELKETFRINTHTESKDVRMETEIARAVASLMNAEGGRLIIGVHDTGEVKGIERDLRVFNGDLDRLERWVLGDLLSKRIDPALIAQFARIDWIQVRGVQICSIEVQRSSKPAWLDDEHLHVRSGNQTLELTGRRLASFLSDRH